MAKTRIGYGQVERQHMAAPHNGQIYAQLPALNADGTVITQLENGQLIMQMVRPELEHLVMAKSGSLYIMKKSYMMRDTKIIKILL